MAIVLSCIDSRVSPEIVFDVGIGGIFDVRVAGNVVNEDIAGSMEYACKLAGSKVILVMGHTNCGAVKGAIDDVRLGNLIGLLTKLKPAVDSVEHVDGEHSSKNKQLVGADTDHTAQNLRSHNLTGVTINDPIEPGMASQMLGQIDTKRVHKDVDIGEDHGAFMTSSRSPERLRSIPGRMPPVAFETGNSIRFRRLVFGFDRRSANPSSTSDVSVRPSSAACFLARFKRSSFILIVVLIHQCNTLMHQYVKL